MDGSALTLISIVIPVFNEAESLPALIQELKGLAESIRSSTAPMEAEFILVDDHSTDASPEIIKAACDQDPRFIFIRLSFNAGSHIAILAGLKRARGDCAVFLAADLQDPPRVVAEMLEKWKGGSQVVWAVRRSRPGTSPFERLTSRFFYWLINKAARLSLPPEGSDFVLLDRQALKALLLSIGSNPSLGGQIALLGFRQSKVFYDKMPRLHGGSKWTLGRKVYAFMDALVSFSYFPIRCISYLGFCVSLLGFIYALFIAYMRFVIVKPIPGWATIIILLLFFGGIQMIMLGVMGEYLWRIFREVKSRAIFFIEEERGGEKGEKN